jgi:uncharacterized membrane protein
MFERVLIQMAIAHASLFFVTYYMEINEGKEGFLPRIAIFFQIFFSFNMFRILLELSNITFHVSNTLNANIFPGYFELGIAPECFTEQNKIGVLGTA